MREIQDGGQDGRPFKWMSLRAPSSATTRNIYLKLYSHHKLFQTLVQLKTIN